MIALLLLGWIGLRLLCCWFRWVGLAHDCYVVGLVGLDWLMIAVLLV